jgi:hypothetical protein
MAVLRGDFFSLYSLVHSMCDLVCAKCIVSHENKIFFVTMLPAISLCKPTMYFRLLKLQRVANVYKKLQNVANTHKEVTLI